MAGTVDGERALVADRTGDRQGISVRLPVSDHRHAGMLNGFFSGMQAGRRKMEGVFAASPLPVLSGLKRSMAGGLKTSQIRHISLLEPEGASVTIRQV